VLSFFSLIASIATYVVSFLAFVSVTVNLKFYVNLFYLIVAIKAFCWSPFLGMEFYDTFFEHIYLDVNF